MKLLVDYGDLFSAEMATGTGPRGIEELVDETYRTFGDGLKTADVSWRAALFDFLLEREAHVFERRDFQRSEVRAVAAFWKRPLSALKRLEALREERGSSDLAALAALLKRVKNITKDFQATLKLEQVKARLKEPAELALADEIDARWPKVHDARSTWRYTEAIKLVVGLRASVDRFFVDVLVMADDASVREARLTLLSMLRDTITSIADISELVPEESKQA
jgi:glycyl-tRNA synthetase beta chain